MPKTKRKRQGTSRPSSNKTDKPGHIMRSAAPEAARQKAFSQQALGQQRKHAQPERRDSKQARIIAMLETPSGATIDAMMRATGWQQHSVRGFLAGVVRKKLGLNLVSVPAEGGRIYRIADAVAKPSANEKVSRAA